MGLVAKMAPYWQCDLCAFEWFAGAGSGPRQCKRCGSRAWNDGLVRDADLLRKSLSVRVLDRYRRPLSLGQKAALLRLAANKRAEFARKKAAVQPAATPLIDNGAR